MIYIIDAPIRLDRIKYTIDRINSVDSNFIFFTSYLKELPNLRKVLPKKPISPNGEKIRNIKTFIRKGNNIATTTGIFEHFLMRELPLENYDCYMELDRIPIETLKITKTVRLTVLKNFVTVRLDGRVDWNDFTLPHENSNNYDELTEAAKNGTLYYFNGIFYKTVPLESLLKFKDCFLLTFLFEKSLFKRLVDKLSIPYQYVEIRSKNDWLMQCSRENWNDCVLSDEFKCLLKRLIHIYEGSLNRNYHYSKKAKLKLQIGKDVYNIFHNHYKVNGSDCLWTSHTLLKKYVASFRYSLSCYLSSTSTEVTDFTNRHYLAYVMDLDIGTNINNLIGPNDIATGLLLKWLLRSALINHEEVYLYIPDKNMRTLFKNYLMTENEKELLKKKKKKLTFLQKIHERLKL